MKERLTLLELNRLVRGVIEDELPEEYWVEAELSECRESRGHCYMELIQKDEQTATPVARASAKCWASKWMVVRPYFERVTGQMLRSGLKVLLKVYAQFHEAFGFSWIVTDIDPTYTLGDMVRKRQEIIQKLKAEGVFDLQRELSLPRFCQHIAVISSETAAGYGDFCRQLSENVYGFCFSVTFFPATMQGEGVEKSIIAALNQVYMCADSVDAIVIIRGGGATADLSGFDTLALAENVANFPIPVITGIGHDRDESILDMVAHLHVKTPTAAAAFLIDHLKEVLDIIDNAQERLAYHAQQRLLTLNAQLATLAEALPRLFATVKTRHDAKLDGLYTSLTLFLERRLTAERYRLQLIEEKTKALDPALLLRRGYSMTMKDGKIVRDAKLLKAGDEIETRLEKGTIKSIIK